MMSARVGSPASAACFQGQTQLGRVLDLSALDAKSIRDHGGVLCPGEIDRQDRGGRRDPAGKAHHRAAGWCPHIARRCASRRRAAACAQRLPHRTSRSFAEPKMAVAGYLSARPVGKQRRERATPTGCPFVMRRYWATATWSKKPVTVCRRWSAATTAKSVPLTTAALPSGASFQEKRTRS